MPTTVACISVLVMMLLHKWQCFYKIGNHRKKLVLAMQNSRSWLSYVENMSLVGRLIMDFLRSHFGKMQP